MARPHRWFGRNVSSPGRKGLPSVPNHSDMGQWRGEYALGRMIVFVNVDIACLPDAQYPRPCVSYIVPRGAP